MSNVVTVDELVEEYPFYNPDPKEMQELDDLLNLVSDDGMQEVLEVLFKYVPKELMNVEPVENLYLMNFIIGLKSGFYSKDLPPTYNSISKPLTEEESSMIAKYHGFKALVSTDVTKAGYLIGKKISTKLQQISDRTRKPNEEELRASLENIYLSITTHSAGKFFLGKRYDATSINNIIDIYELHPHPVLLKPLTDESIYEQLVRSVSRHLTRETRILRGVAPVKIRSSKTTSNKYN